MAYNSGHIKFSPHSQKQDDVIFSEALLTIAATGIQWGKTQAGCVWIKKLIHTFTDETDNFIITAPNYKIMQQSSLPRFKQYMRGCGEYNKVDAEFKVYKGGTVYLRTGTDPDSIVGIPNVRGIWSDEAGKYSLYFWENIQARSAFYNCPVLLTTSPYTLNWLYKQFIKPFMKGDLTKELKDKLIYIVQASSIENPFFNKESYERQRRTMDPVRFNMLYGGQWGRMEGLVYKCWDDEENQVDDSIALSPKTRYFAGIDWGYTHPCHIGIRAITPDGMHYKIMEYHHSGKTISDIKEQCIRFLQMWPIEMFWCGPDQPGYIDELNRARIPAMAANNDVRVGIDKHYELIKSRKFKMLRGRCPHTLDEIDTYHYPEPKDLKPDQDDKDHEPVKVSDDAVDADRYCTIETYDLAKLDIKLPKKDKLDPRWPKTSAPHTERFS